jgi:hypothetical protein
MRLHFLAITIVLFAADSSLAGEAAYMPVRKFLPLRQPSINQHSRQPLIINEAKFFPLAPNRYAIAPRAAESRNDIVVKNEGVLPPSPPANQTSVKSSMTQQQAQQILSIFSQKP